MAETKAKRGFFGSIAKFFKEVKSELKKVTWPTREQLFRSTAVVIASIIIIGLFIWILDAVFGLGTTTLIKR